MSRSLTVPQQDYLTIAGKERLRLRTIASIAVSGGSTYVVSDYGVAPMLALSGVSLDLSSFRPIVLEWGEIPPVLIRDDGVPDIQETTIRLWNGPWQGSRIGDALTSAALGARVKIVTWAELSRRDSYAEAPTLHETLQVFDGVLRAVETVTEWEIVIRVGCRASNLIGRLDHLVTDDYPTAPPSAIGKIQPLVYGTVYGMPLIPVDVGHVGRLATAIADDGLVLEFDDEIAAWPDVSFASDYYFQIGGTEWVQSSRSFAASIDRDAKTITLGAGVGASGTCRGRLGTLASSWPVGTPVIYQPETYKFLVADADPGAINNVARVYLGGKPLSTQVWSTGPSNTVEITPGGGRAGRRMITRVEGQANGIVFPGVAQGATQTVLRSSGIQDRPLMGMSHLHLAPRSTNPDLVWPCVSNPRSGSSYPSDPDDVADLSTVALHANTSKQWVANIWDDYIPSSTLFTPTEFRVDIELQMPGRTVTWNTPSSGSFTHRRPKPQRVKAIHCDVNTGLTTVRRTIPVGIDDQFANGDLGSSPLLPHFNGTFSFGPDIDPTAAPFRIDITAESDATDGLPVAYVKALSQGVNGVLSQPATGEVDTPATSYGGDWTSSETFVFTNLFSAGIMSLSVYMACDYVQIGVPGTSKRVTMPNPIYGTGRPAETNVQATPISIICPSGSGVISVTAKNYDGSGSPQYALEQIVMSELVVAKRPLLPPGDAESAFLLEFGAYPTADVAGYPMIGDDDNPTQVIGHFLREVCGETESIDETVIYSTGGTSYTDTRLSGVIRDPLEKRAILGWMARQARAWVWWDSWADVGTDGTWRIQERESPAELLGNDVTAAITAADIVGTPEIQIEREEDVVELVRLAFARDWAAGSDQAYMGVEESGTSGGRTSDERYRFDLVRSRAAAASLAAFYSSWDTVIKRTVAITLWPEFSYLQRGDVVTLTIPYAGGGGYLHGLNATKFVVHSCSFVPGNAPSNSPDVAALILIEIPT